MTKYTIIPKLCKVLNIYYTPFAYNGYCDKTVKGRRFVIGKYYQAEHSKTPGLYKGDNFIIKEHYVCVK